MLFLFLDSLHHAEADCTSDVWVKVLHPSSVSRHEGWECDTINITDRAYKIVNWVNLNSGNYFTLRNGIWFSFRRYYLVPFKSMITSFHIPQEKSNLFYPVAFYIGPKFHGHLKQRLLDILQKVIGLANLRTSSPR